MRLRVDTAWIGIECFSFISYLDNKSMDILGGNHDPSTQDKCPPTPRYDVTNMDSTAAPF
jgi:hypothetical protein